MADLANDELILVDGVSKKFCRSAAAALRYGLKDIVDTKGIPTTCHSKILKDNVPTSDATCAVKLAEAGSVMMGKTATHEFADGGDQRESASIG